MSNQGFSHPSQLKIPLAAFVKWYREHRAVLSKLEQALHANEDLLASLETADRLAAMASDVLSVDSPTPSPWKRQPIPLSGSERPLQNPIAKALRTHVTGPVVQSIPMPSRDYSKKV